MLRTILFYTYFWITVLLSTLIGLPYCLLRLAKLDKPFRAPIQLFVRLWAKGVIGSAGARVKAEGLEKVPRTGNLCIVMNHQGDFDIMVTLALLKRTVGFVAKSQTLFVPIVNLWIYALGSVFIDRGNPRKSMKSIEKGVRRIAEGNALVIYPEGTRSRGPRMGEFKGGSLKLATRANAVILPVSIDGTWRLWEEKKRIRAADVSFVVHDPIPTEGMGPEERKALPERIAAIIASRIPGSDYRPKA